MPPQAVPRPCAARPGLAAAQCAPGVGCADRCRRCAPDRGATHGTVPPPPGRWAVGGGLMPYRGRSGPCMCYRSGFHRGGAGPDHGQSSRGANAGMGWTAGAHRAGYRAGIRLGWVVCGRQGYGVPSWGAGHRRNLLTVEHTAADNRSGLVIHLPPRGLVVAVLGQASDHRRGHGNCPRTRPPGR